MGTAIEIILEILLASLILDIVIDLMPRFKRRGSINFKCPNCQYVETLEGPFCTCPQPKEQ